MANRQQTLRQPSKQPRKPAWNLSFEEFRVNRELSTPQAWWATSAAAPWLRSSGIVLGGTAFVAACAHVALPLWFTPVPLTLQPFAVLLLGLLLSPRMAAATLEPTWLKARWACPFLRPARPWQAALPTSSVPPAAI